MDASHVSFFVLASVAGLGCIGVLALVIYTLRVSSRKTDKSLGQSAWQSLKKIRIRCPVCGQKFFALSRYCAHCGARAKSQQVSASSQVD